MTPEQQRIKIAEACGWKFHPLTEHPYTQEEKAAAIMCWVRPGNDSWRTGCVPDYLNDLNAMHEAEKVLDIVAERGDYWDYLSFITGGEDEMIYATASQRAEAFLRTLDKWEETP